MQTWGKECATGMRIDSTTSCIFACTSSAACIKHRFILFPKRSLNSGPRWLIGITEKTPGGPVWFWEGLVALDWNLKDTSVIHLVLCGSCFGVFFFYVAPAQSASNCLNMHQSPSIPSATCNRPAAPCARLMKETEEQSGSSQGGAETAAPNGALSLFFPPVSGAGGINYICRCFTVKATGRI